MRNCVVTVVGQKGSGKTTLAKLLIASAPRAVIIDRLFEHEGDFVTANCEDALDYLATNWRGQFRLVARFNQDEHYALLFRYLSYTTQKIPAQPISVLIEEEDFFASPASIEPTLDYMYKYGRHSRINLLGVARGDTDLHRSIIGNSDCLISMRMHKFSKEMREKFDASELENLRRMETLTPNLTPIKGTHYLVYPDTPEKSVDPFALWRSHMGTLAPNDLTKGEKVVKLDTQTPA